MTPNLTNLLPADRTRSLRRVYFVRLAVVSVLLIAGVAVVHGVLLLPSYLFVQHEVNERRTELALLSERLSGTEEKEVSARVEALGNDAEYLASLATSPKASAAVRAVISLPREGVRLLGFSFMTNAEGASMTVSGIAATRESLRRFEQTLAAQSYIETADLPISAYAKERDIPFMITLTGTLTP